MLRLLYRILHQDNQRLSIKTVSDEGFEEIQKLINTPFSQYISDFCKLVITEDKNYSLYFYQTLTKEDLIKLHNEECGGGNPGNLLFKCGFLPVFTSTCDFIALDNKTENIC